MDAVAVVARWQGGQLVPRDDCDVTPAEIVAADSWLVRDGAVRALDLHRRRFAAAVTETAVDGDAVPDVDAFWDAAIAALPRTGDLFPRVEARRGRGGALELLLRTRPAPELRPAIRLATWDGADPRTSPRVKGPDLEAMTRLRTGAQARGADEAVLLEPDGAVAEGSTSCLVWWRGDALCLPDDGIARIDSVTVRSVLALAAALGVDVLRERATPRELEGLEIWALNALHGIRIVTEWIDGPSTAEEPGRRGVWQARLDALRRPLPSTDGAGTSPARTSP
jgi:branched-subunit amino acid aminotransferase/4-amino-4-deoxychorismate lyase